ncbi:MAG TPA: MbtH family protein [Acidocella sp.]|nr:MbtH family protein [Acidocella sp.]
MSSPFDDQESLYFTLVNTHEQYSIWPLFLDVPAGWTVAAGPMSRADTLAWIDRAWTKVRVVADGSGG